MKVGLLAASSSGLDRWNAPTWSKPLPGAVARASVRFDSNYTAGAWVDLFVGDSALVPTRGPYASLRDAIDGARLATQPGTFLPGAIGVFDLGVGRGFELRPLMARNVRHFDEDPRGAELVPFQPASGWKDAWGMARRTEGVLALDEGLRAIVDGDVLPMVSRRG